MLYQQNHLNEHKSKESGNDEGSSNLLAAVRLGKKGHGEARTKSSDGDQIIKESGCQPRASIGQLRLSGVGSVPILWGRRRSCGWSEGGLIPENRAAVDAKLRAGSCGSAALVTEHVMDPLSLNDLYALSFQSRKPIPAQAHSSAASSPSCSPPSLASSGLVRGRGRASTGWRSGRVWPSGTARRASNRRAETSTRVSRVATDAL